MTLKQIPSLLANQAVTIAHAIKDVIALYATPDSFDKVAKAHSKDKDKATKLNDKISGLRVKRSEFIAESRENLIQRTLRIQEAHTATAEALAEIVDHHKGKAKEADAVLKTLRSK